MNLSIFKSSQKFFSDNATGILTGVGVVGTVATAVLTSRASFKAAELIGEKKDEEAAILDLKKGEKENRTLEDFELSDRNDITLTTFDTMKVVWPQFILPVASGSVTVAAIISANRINAQRIAALAAVYSISEGRLKEVQNKLQEKLTGPKAVAAQKEITEERMKRGEPTAVNREVIILDGKNVLCFDEYSGRYFNSTMEAIKQAELSTNGEIYNHGFASLSYFYDELEVPPTKYSDSVGWNSTTNGMVHLRFTSIISPDGKPCLSIDFVTDPGFNYSTLY